MARRGTLDTVVRVGLYGAIGYGVFSLARAGSLGADAERAAGELAQAFSSATSAPPGGPTPPAALPGTRQTLPLRGVCDWGDFCALLIEPGRNLIHQDPAMGGTNSYGPGSVFRYQGQTLHYLGGLEFWSDVRGQFTWGTLGD